MAGHAAPLALVVAHEITRHLLSGLRPSCPSISIPRQPDCICDCPEVERRPACPAFDASSCPKVAINETVIAERVKEALGDAPNPYLIAAPSVGAGGAIALIGQYFINRNRRNVETRPNRRRGGGVLEGPGTR